MTVTARETVPVEPAGSGRQARPLLLDVDVHPLFLPRDILPRLPEPWRTRYANENSGGGARVVRDYLALAQRHGFRLDAAVPWRTAGQWTSMSCAHSCSMSTAPASPS